MLYMRNKILGEWYGRKTIPLLASGECRIIFCEDGTAKADGKVKILGDNMEVSADDITWEHCGENRFVGKYRDYHIEFIIQNGCLKTTVNPYKLGAVTNPKYDMNIPLEIKRR